MDIHRGYIKVFELCLVVTEKCNLNCLYCYNNKTFKRTMPLHTAITEIDRMFGKYVDYDSFDILFMGGEPFLAFDLIKDIVAYIGIRYSDKKVSYTVVTNGTLIKEEIQDWIIKHQSHFQIIFSIDGMPDVQNENRSDSSRNIDWAFILNHVKKPIVNMVITPKSLSSLYNNGLYLHSQNVFIKSFLADGMDWQQDHIQILGSELFKLINYYLDHPELYPISMLSMPIHYLNKGEPTRCGQLENGYTITPDGIRYACHRCSPFENNGKWAIPDHLLDLKEARYLDDRCKSCPIEKICNACPALNAAIMYDSYQKSIQCQLRKTLFKANAYFYIRLLIDNPTHVLIRKLGNERRSALAKSAEIIQEKLEIQNPF